MYGFIGFIDDLWIDDESIYLFIKYVKKLKDNI